jgi:hypothetical protein
MTPATSAPIAGSSLPASFADTVRYRHATLQLPQIGRVLSTTTRSPRTQVSMTTVPRN